MSKQTGKIIMTVATFALIGLVLVLRSAGSVEVLGLSVPVGVVAIVGYLLGLLAGWAAMQRSDS